MEDRPQSDNCWRLTTGCAGLLLGVLGLLFRDDSLSVAVKLAGTEATAATLFLIAVTSGPEWLPRKDDYSPPAPPRDPAFFLRIGRFWLIAFALIFGTFLVGSAIDRYFFMAGQRICNENIPLGTLSPKEAQHARMLCFLAAQRD